MASIDLSSEPFETTSREPSSSTRLSLQTPSPIPNRYREQDDDVFAFSNRCSEPKIHRKTLLFLFRNSTVVAAAAAAAADSGSAPCAACRGVAVAIGLHRAEIGERVLGGGRDEEEASAEAEVDEGIDPRRGQVRADQEEASRTEAPHGV